MRHVLQSFGHHGSTNLALGDQSECRARALGARRRCRTPLGWQVNIYCQTRCYVAQSLRINLPRHHCVYLGIDSEFTLSLEEEEALDSFMRETHTHTLEDISGEEPATMHSLFGSLSKMSGAYYLMHGLITKSTRVNGIHVEFSVSLSRSESKPPQPPKGIKPVHELIDRTAQMFGSRNIQCRAEFEYAYDQGFKSKVVLPIPLMFKGIEESITHIESAQFSHRTDDNIDYRIAVINHDASERFFHFVEFEKEIELNRENLRQLIGEAQNTSSRLLINERETS